MTHIIPVMAEQQLASLVDRVWDVIVIGGGNAALVSAMSAHDNGASVLILERGDKFYRGGNSRHTRNIRCVHGADSAWNTGAYTRDEVWKDLGSVGTGPNNVELARLTVDESESVPGWMVAHGGRFQRPLAGTLHLGRTNTFFLGGGKALINSYYRTIEKTGIPVLYEAMVTDLEFDGLRCTGVVTQVEGQERTFRGKSVVCAAGGFEANIEWLQRYWGDAALNYHIRGTRLNDGTVLKLLLDAGANQEGEERGFHAVALDARSLKFDSGIATRTDSIPFGIVLNKEAKRFYDEGEDVWPKRYAIWGKNLALQTDQLGFAIWDSKMLGEFLPPMYGSFSANTIEDLVVQFKQFAELDPSQAAATVAEYNAGVPADAARRFDPAVLDGVASTATPPKSNWAMPIDTPPFYGIPLRPGITFTYLGVQVGRDARIQRTDGSQFDNVFAAGEIMSGNILSSGYMAGFGMTIGTVWGRIAGREAAGA